ncbi:MAG: Fic family protein [Mycobacterium sp.]
MDKCRHAVEQAIAAERLEGWRPTDEQVADLGRLARGELPFGQYLAAYRSRHPAPVQPSKGPGRLFRRAKPYLIPGTELLRNNFGATSAAMLADLEFVATAGRLLTWQLWLADGPVDVDALDLRRMHQHVFADVYAWAGQYRVTELRRGDTVFAPQAGVAEGAARIESAARELAGAELDEPGLAYELSRLYADYNQIHPFREGNGRTGTLLLHTVSALCGYRLDLSGFSRLEWYGASRDSTPFRRDGRANHRPFLPLLRPAVRRPC